jgi:predicted small lipoprotein YifL
MAAFAALALAGCGRYGPLEPPPEPNAAAKPAPAPAAPGSGASMSSLAKTKIPPITPPNQPFILDPLLK